MKGLRLAAALLALVACTQPLDRSQPADARRAAERNADLDALVAAVETVHPDPFGALNEKAWRSDVAAARARVGAMNDDDFLVTVARLTNLGARNGHGGVFPTVQPALDMWPVRLYDFVEGWYVVDAVDRSLVGAKVEAIGGTPIAQVVRALTPMVSFDNEYTARARLGSYLVVPAFLRGSGLPSGPMTIVDPAGARRDVTPQAVTPETYAALTGQDVPQIAVSLPRPSWAPDDMWWSARRGDALVIGYERVENETPEGKQLRRFADTVREEVAARPPRVVVLDLRRNPGGENDAAHPLVVALREVATDKRIPVRVLIARTSYSATCVLLATLRRDLPARYYGEPTGGGSRTFGNPEQRTLPNSGIVFFVSGQEATAAGPYLAAIEPDVAVAQRWSSWRAGHDDVLDAALAP